MKDGLEKTVNEKSQCEPEKVVFILGPTGAGKSEMAIELAKKFNGEIISADSVQIFKGFDIGSAKLRQSQMGGIKHHCLDICAPTERFTVFDFVKVTRQKIEEISSKGKLPIVVGGTGLYAKSMMEGYNFGDVDVNFEFRLRQQEFAQEYGAQALWQKLEKLDKSQAEKINANNVKRVIRALEVATFGSKKTKQDADFKFVAYALTMQREKLYQNINLRVDKMVKDGLFDEVESLLKGGVPQDCQPMQAIGYKEVVAYLNGQTSKERAVELVKQHTRNYAKRQLTFLRGMSCVQFVDVQDKQAALNLLSQGITQFLEDKYES